jgi:gas vesicle protein
MLNMTTTVIKTIPKKEKVITLREIANIDGNIKFLESFFNKYKNETGISKKLSADLKAIKKKNADETLTMSVIGEFSSGKSTFINALLRMNLLEKNIISGTTVATTIIEYGEVMTLTLRHKNGKKDTYGRYSYSASNLTDDEFMAEFKNRILAATTDGNLALSLSEVVIALPSPILKEGIRIVDTPGTNAVERWHEDVTKTAIRETSDVSIIITALTNAMTASLLDFVEDNLSGVIDNCIFVATMPDLVKPAERSRTLRNAQNKVKNKFNRNDLPILSYTPLYVLGSVDKEVMVDAKSLKSYSEKDCNALIVESVQTEQTIFNMLSERRVIIQVKKLLTIFDESFSSLSTLLKKLSSDLEKKRQNLEKSKKRDLTAFTAEMKKKYIDSYKFISDFGYPSVYKYSVYSKIDDCKDATALKAFSETLKSGLNDIGTSYTDQAKKAQTYYLNEAKKQLKDFWKDFDKFYIEFDEISIPEPSFEPTSLSAVSHTSNHSSAVEKAFEAYDNTTNTIMGSGFIAGAAVGTAIMPGIGTVLGAIAGVVAGAFVSPNIDTTKTKMKHEAEIALDNMDNECKTEYDNICKGYRAEFEQFIRDQIDKCASLYSKEVSRMIAANEKEQKELSLMISTVKDDLAEIKKHKDNAALIAAKLSTSS